MSSLDLGPLPATSPAASADTSRLRAAPDRAPAAPAATADPVLASPRAARTDPDTLLFRAQSLALARQEELRLQERLSALRQSIEATEAALRDMQQDTLSPR